MSKPLSLPTPNGSTLTINLDFVASVDILRQQNFKEECLNFYEVGLLNPSSHAIYEKPSNARTDSPYLPREDFIRLWKYHVDGLTYKESESLVK